VPPYSTLKTYLQAVNTGQTNITRVLTTLMQYPAQWRGKQIEVNPHLSKDVSDEFKAPGRMTSDEINHIENQWPMAQKQDLLTAVLTAIEAKRPMVFKWTLTTDPTPKTDIVWPPNDAPPTVPVQVTFRSPADGVTFALDGEGSDKDVVVAV
jgi:hypothetical protein